MRKASVFVTMLLLPFPAQAQNGFVCDGHTPDWALNIAQDTARFAFAGRDLSFEIPQSSTAEGRDWPRTYTLIADFDTAIVVLDDAQCGDDSYRAHVLTQRGQNPILLTGCCEAAE